MNENVIFSVHSFSEIEVVTEESHSKTDAL